MASSWAATGSTSYTRRNQGGSGTVSSALVVGGYTSGSAKTDTFNGSTWSAGGDYARSIYGPGGCGASPSATIMVGGYSGGAKNETYTYNGSSWSDTGHNMAVGCYNIGITGTSSASLETGYNDGNPTNTYKYNGTSWSSTGSLSANSDSAPLCGSSSAGLLTGYDYATAPTAYLKTAIYNGSTWSDSTSLPGLRGAAGSFGTTSSALTFGGNGPSTSYLSSSLLFNGSTWSTDATCGTASSVLEGAGNIGSVTSGLKTNGQIASNTGTDICEIYTGDTGGGGSTLLPRLTLLGMG